MMLLLMLLWQRRWTRKLGQRMKLWILLTRQLLLVGRLDWWKHWRQQQRRLALMRKLGQQTSQRRSCSHYHRLLLLLRTST
jgi:hypothetical protein